MVNFAMEIKPKTLFIMETKNLRLKTSQRHNGSRKGGVNNTQTILTAAGAMAVGGVAGVVSADALHGALHTQGQQAATDSAGSQNGTATAQNQHTPPPQTENTQPQTAGHQQQSQTENAQPQTAEHPQQPVTPTQNGEQPTPEQVAGGLVSQVDRNDIDAPDVVAVDGFDKIFAEDGSEINVAFVHTPDGGQFIFADADGDGVYDGIFDSDGNFVSQVEGYITHSDLEDVMNDSGGFLAINSLDGNINPDIEGEDVIGIEADGEPVSDDDLLAQLLGQHGSGEGEDTIVEQVNPDVPTDGDDDLAYLDPDDDSTDIDDGADIAVDPLL